MHGSDDEVVAPANASALVQQWLDIHPVDAAGAVLDEVDGQARTSWRDGSGAILVEHYVFDGMAHGLPVDAKSHGLTGTLAPFVPEAGISSTIRIAKSWGLLKRDPPADADLGFETVGIAFEIEVFIFERPPQPFDEDIVHQASPAIHRDSDSAFSSTPVKAVSEKASRPCRVYSSVM
jgi:hypothetical protein